MCKKDELEILIADADRKPYFKTQNPTIRLAQTIEGKELAPYRAGLVLKYSQMTREEKLQAIKLLKERYTAKIQGIQETLTDLTDLEQTL